MARYRFDCETNGLLPEVSLVHTIIFTDVDTGQKYRGLDHVYAGDPARITVSIAAALAMLSTADELIGHNIIAYDLPVLQKLHAFTWKPDCKITDTLVLGKLLYPDTSGWDGKLIKERKLDSNLFGRYSLKAWGQRLEMPKGEYTGGWEKWTPEMQVYGERDDDVTGALLLFLLQRKYSPRAVKLEHDVVFITEQIERNGFPFDKEGALALHAKLAAEYDSTTKALQDIFPARLKRNGKPFAPKRDDAKKGYVAGCELSKLKLEAFNPGSRDDIRFWFKVRYKWKPTEYTDGGDPKIDDDILEELPYPEAKPLARLFMLDKRMGAILGKTEKAKAWLNKLKPDGRIHARYSSVNGTDTRRAAHYDPNIGQVPSVDKPFGVECRSLFHAAPGYKQVGADLSALEDRCFGHYLSPHDGGLYWQESVSGVDPHVKVGNMTGLIQRFGPQLGRTKAKRARYAIMYGAMDPKVGETLDGTKADGAKFRKEFFGGITGLNKLMNGTADIEGLNQKVDRTGRIRLIDGGTIAAGKRTALNYLLQGTGAILCKQWMVTAERMLRERGLRHGVGLDYALLAWVHDELQYEVKEGLEHVVGDILVQAALSAGRELGFVPPLEAKYKVGRNWADTH